MDDERDPDPPEPTEQQWKLFEREVARVLAELDPNARVEHDVRIRGHLGGTTRQIDALITSDVVAHPVMLVAECKRYTRRIGIGLVDEFVGKLLDVGASGGIMYAFAGYTEDAKARAAAARNPSVELRQLPEAEEEDYTDFIATLKFGDCANENCYTGTVDWTESTDDEGASVTWGICDTCGTVAVRCSECEEITALGWGEKQECDACEAVYAEVRDRDGLVEAVRRVS